jgi:ActR/RegA family two-component response regulator
MSLTAWHILTRASSALDWQMGARVLPRDSDLSEASRVLNVNRFTLSRYLKEQKVLNGLYKFSYLD